MTKTCNLILMLFLLVCFGCTRQGAEENQPDVANWSVYLGDKHSTQYSSLNQINKSNVQNLEIAWTYHTGDSEGREIQCNPIIIDSVLYATTGRLKCIALHAGTGELIWSFNPFANIKTGGGNNRGLAYWEDGDDKRIFHCAGSQMYALDALTGEPVVSFGDSGSISLHEGLGERAQDLWVIVTTPGIIFKDLYIVGGRVSEGFNAAPGYIRAFNVRSGELEWMFHTIPHPGEEGYDTWPPNAYQTVGGVNSWAGMALDEEREIVYIPTGSASFDSYGGNRPGKNLFANSLIALDANTGERIWHYQTIHHDIWDMDLPSPPNLVVIERNGEQIPAVAQVTKTGNTFVFHRETGEPLFPIKQIEIDSSDVPGEEAWPTQPMPELPPPFARQVFTDELITDISPESHEYISNELKKYRYGKMLIPPNLQGTVVFPGFDGGAEWGGAAVDPYKGILYVNSNEMVWTVQLTENKDYQTVFTESTSPGNAVYSVHCASCHGQDLSGDNHYGYPSLISVYNKYNMEEARAIIEGGKGMMPGFSYLSEKEIDAVLNFIYGKESDTSLNDIEKLPERVILPYGHNGFHRLLDPDGYPAIKPPWGNLTAIDLNTAEILWQVPLGSFDELTKKGIPRTGTENYGGPVVTAGGLIFIAASKDERMHIFDKQTGELLREIDLPAGGYATPATYMTGGKQYVVIACGGDKMGTKSGDAYVAFALPE